MTSDNSIDVATFRAPRFGGVLTLGSFQSPRAARGRAFSATVAFFPFPEHILFRGFCLLARNATSFVLHSLGGSGCNLATAGICR